MSTTVTELVHEFASQLKSLYTHKVEQEQIVWWLLEMITDKSHAQLIAQNTLITQKQIDQLKKLVKKHLHTNIPLQYLIGWVPFADIHIAVESPVLIPRPETEEWVLKLITQLKPISPTTISILELCTGSGCIALALAHALPNACIDATDISQKALDLARKNANLNSISNVHFIQSDVYNQLDQSQKYDLIIANPPYIAPNEWNNLSLMVTQWEDKNALIADEHGLAIIKRIINGAPFFLHKNQSLIKFRIPQLWIELGYQQSIEVKKLAQKAQFYDINIEKDLSEKNRLLTAYYYPKA